MDISFEEQTKVLEHLDQARELLIWANNDRLQSDFKRATIIDHISACFHDVQQLESE